MVFGNIESGGHEGGTVRADSGLSSARNASDHVVRPDREFIRPRVEKTAALPFDHATVEVQLLLRNY